MTASPRTSRPRRPRPLATPSAPLSRPPASCRRDWALPGPVVGGWSDGGQATLELGARHPGTAAALIAGAASPDFDAGGIREAHRALLGVDASGNPNLAHLDAELGEFADEVKAFHPGGAGRWRSLVRQTAPMWLDYEGLGPEELGRIQAAVLVLAGDRDELIPLDLSVSLYRALPDAELAAARG
jgi:pimeloyl-ACP methyl ester carboxylesterase